MRRVSAFLALTVVVAIAGVSAPSPPADGNQYWPQWRGPLANGVAPAGDPPVEWAAGKTAGKNIKWKAEIPGKGAATPIVWGDRIFVLTAVPTDKRPPGKEGPPAEAAPAEGAQAGPRRLLQPEYIQQFMVIAINRKDGKTLWQTIVREELPHEGANPNATITWASSSPVTDGQMVYAYFGSRGLYALDMKGNVKWERDLGDMTTGFGEGSSPALDGDHLVVNWDHEGESFIVALDKKTGKDLWRTPRDEKTTYSTPLIVEHGGKKQVITAGATRVRSYDLADGKLLWEGPGLTPGCVASPVHSNGVVYVMSGFRGSALYAIRLAEAKGDISAAPQALVWKYDRDTPWVPSPLLYGDELYFLKSNNGILSVVNAKTGEKLYGEQRLDGVSNVYASPVGAAGRIYIAGRDGVVAVIARGPQFKLLALNQLDDGFDASPVVVGNELYLRGRKYLYRISKD
ncbi:MAG: PQQ-binding-like beta-propeller repeat protein [Candidatus Acidiferrales bacterium]